MALSTLAVPTKSDPLEQLVEDNWAKVKEVTSPEVLKAFKAIGQLGAFAGYDDAKVWEAIRARREGAGAQTDGEAQDLKGPEWEVFSRPESAGSDRRLPLAARRSSQGATADPSRTWSSSSVCGRCGRWSASPASARRATSTTLTEVPDERRMPITRRPPRWVPASEVRGEGIFIRFDEAEISAWCDTTLPASGSKSSWRPTASGAG